MARPRFVTVVGQSGPLRAAFTHALGVGTPHPPLELPRDARRSLTELVSDLVVRPGPMFVFVADTVAASSSARPATGLDLVDHLLLRGQKAVVLVAHLPLARLAGRRAGVTENSFTPAGYPTLVFPFRATDLVRIWKGIVP